MADSKAGSVASWLRIDKLPTGGWKKMDNSLFGRKHEEDPGYANSLKLNNMCLEESCDADEVKPKELRNLNLYDDQSREVLEATELLTNTARDGKQADEGNTNELPKHSSDDKQGRWQHSSSDETALSAKKKTPGVCWQIKNIKWYEITMSIIVFICHLSPVVGGQPDSRTPCSFYSTKDFWVLTPLKPNEDCERILQQHSCKSGYVEACIRNLNHSSLVPVCTKNICLDGQACAEYQQYNATDAVINTRLGECPSCSNSSTLEDRMKTGEGRECLKLKSQSNETTTPPPPTTNTTDETTPPPPPTTNTTTITSAGPRSSMPNINVIMLLLIIAVVM